MLSDSRDLEHGGWCMRLFASDPVLPMMSGEVTVVPRCNWPRHVVRCEAAPQAAGSITSPRPLVAMSGLALDTLSLWHIVGSTEPRE
jgi:hypothetical protein